MTIDATIPPLVMVIDLDGTLIKTNSLDETFLDVLRTDPFALWQLPIHLIFGRAATKAFLAARSSLDVEGWPVREDFLNFVKRYADEGRTVVLATAADRSVAEAVAARFPFINEVITSAGERNLKGKAKAEHLLERFPDGFIYAGDSAADLEVWRLSAGCVLVGTSPKVTRRARQLHEPVAVFPRQPFQVSLMARSLRLHQWAKNALVFVPLMLGGKAGDAAAWVSALLGFLALGIVASATYIINDLWDLPTDRRHWSRRSRPLASGDLSIRGGLLVAATALAAGFAIGVYIGPWATIGLAAYVAVSLAYSFYLKLLPILDVFTLASLFTLRLGLGIVLADVRLSPWLLVFSMFTFFSLSLAKRQTELAGTGDRGKQTIPRRGYLASDGPLILGLGLASALSAVLIVTLYLIEDAFPRHFYAHPAALWVVPPILFLFLGRIWLLCQRGQLHDDPVAFALKDKTSLLLGLCIGLAFASAVL